MDQHRTRSRRASSNRRENDTDGVFKVLMLQSAIAVFALAIAFSVRLLEQDSFLAFKQTFHEMLKSTEEVEQVGGWLDGVKKQLDSFVEEYFPKAEEENGSDDQVEKEGQKQSAASTAQNEPEGADYVTLNGQGGQNKVSLLQAQNERLTAPDGAVLSPVYISNWMTLPVNGPITSAFGYRVHPITGEPDFHTGLDIAAAAGTNIGAALGGTVKEVGQDEIYGNFIILEHGNGIETMYAHCQDILARQGMRIRREETIARVGSTGLSTGPHVHFEVRVQEQRVNPRWVLEPGSLPQEESEESSRL